MSSSSLPAQTCRRYSASKTCAASTSLASAWRSFGRQRRDVGGEIDRREARRHGLEFLEHGIGGRRGLRRQAPPQRWPADGSRRQRHRQGRMPSTRIAAICSIIATPRTAGGGVSERPGSSGARPDRRPGAGWPSPTSRPPARRRSSCGSTSIISHDDAASSLFELARSPAGVARPRRGRGGGRRLQQLQRQLVRHRQQHARDRSPAARRPGPALRTSAPRSAADRRDRRSTAAGPDRRGRAARS